MDYWNNHRQIQHILEKKCNICQQWFPCTTEYFYKNKLNAIDSLYPYCKKCAIEKNLKWREEDGNREKVNASNAKYTKTNPNGRTAKRNYDKMRASTGKTKEYYQNNTSKFQEYNKNRKGKNHNITEEQWDSCKKYFNYECAYCGLPIDKHFIKYRGSIKLSDLHKEHVDDDGDNTINNCVPSCKSCNSHKWKYEFEEWYNGNNIIFSEERKNKILKWINDDWKNKTK